MKTKVSIIKFILPALILTSCSTSNDLGITSVSLKNSLDNNVNTLTNAVDNIISSPDYQLLSGSSSTSASQAPLESRIKSDFIDTVNIGLSDISGIYEYSWKKVAGFTPYPYFKRTADDSLMIVRMPESKVLNPGHMFDYYDTNDSTLKNNFEADVHAYNYHLALNDSITFNINSDFSIDSTSVGLMNLSYSLNRTNGFDYLSSYLLSTGYKLVCQASTGDTTVTSFSILKNDSILYREATSSYKSTTDDRMHERTYSLTIGNVEIVRNQGTNSLDSAKVYLDGELQTNAKVQIIVNDSDSTDQTVAQQDRDIKITFDDGTSTTLQQLTANTIDNIDKIYNTVYEANFATNVIDKIAFHIYANKQ